MANQLLIRVYDVGLGDCIYVRIPGAKADNRDEDAFHMLIDCGTWSSGDLLVTALDHLARQLPVVDGKSRLDLVVVTHEHKDHIAGFDPALWSKFAVGKVWMNCAMNREHPQAGKSHKVQKVAETAIAGLDSLGASLSPRLAELASVFGIGNAGAMTTLRTALLGGEDPTYVSAGQTARSLKLALPPDTDITVVAPEFDFDRFYLGQTAQTNLKGLIGAAAFNSEDDTVALPVPAEPAQPANISPASFRALRGRMQSSALAFAELDGKLKNNSSVVLLITWQKKRLLFVGDAEWAGPVKPDKMNGSWNVMWDQRKDLLNAPVDFLKIGHHGSENATPWDMGSGKQTQEMDILDTILPVARADKARAVASTERGKYRTIPRGKLLQEIARRVVNISDYATVLTGFKPRDPADYKEFEEPWLAGAQPPRTDFERIRNNNKAAFIDVLIP